MPFIVLGTEPQSYYAQGGDRFKVSLIVGGSLGVKKRTLCKKGLLALPLGRYLSLIENLGLYFGSLQSKFA